MDEDNNTKVEIRTEIRYELIPFSQNASIAIVGSFTSLVDGSCEILIAIYNKIIRGSLNGDSEETFNSYMDAIKKHCDYIRSVNREDQSNNPFFFY
jgi:hypothetical protein